MILTKRQIIQQSFSGFICPEEILERAIRKLLSYPEEVFEEMIRKQLNWKLEVVRKNLYIVTV